MESSDLRRGPRPPVMSQMAQEVRRLSVTEWGPQRAVNIVGRDPALLELQRKVCRVADFDESVLIIGESGVGKESLAQALYLLGPRRGKPFISVNCPQYREGNLTVSELFGHRKGSFTGAIADRKGCFETAGEGIIFLDEIGDLHMSAQVMLLRTLASGEFQPLGADVKKRADARVIAATNRPTEKLRVGEHFRNDLFFRLRYFLLEVPPLRERGDDWLLLLDYFLEDLQQQHGVRKRFSAGSKEILRGYHWPGNVRELRSVLTMGYAMAENDTIEPADFRSLLADDGELGSGHDPYYRMVVQGESFWEAVHAPFLARDLDRARARETIRKGLREAAGSYRQLVPLFNLDDGDYQRFMDFLRHHRLKPAG